MSVDGIERTGLSLLCYFTHNFKYMYITAFDLSLDKRLRCVLFVIAQPTNASSFMF